MILALILQNSSVSSWISFLPMIAIFAIFYFLLFLPMQRQKKQTQNMLANLKKGDQVVTSGGIIGTIVNIGTEDTLVIRVKPSGVEMQMARSAVTALYNPTGAASS